MEITQLPTTVSSGFFRAFCPNPCLIYDLGELYAEFNSKYFNGDLPVLDVKTVEDADGEVRNSYPKLIWDGRMRKLWGSYNPSAAPGKGKISLSKQCASDPVQVRSTLLHEMLHKWLDLKGLDDGIKGHGPNFTANANRINRLCEAKGVEYRINFFNEEITKDQPEATCELLGEVIYCSKDLDIARAMQTILRSAFDTNFDYTV